MRMLIVCVKAVVDSCIVTRDRSPVMRQSEDDIECSDDSSSEDDMFERVVVPPYVNCVVKDLDAKHLPHLLNAQVKFTCDGNRLVDI